MINQSKIVSVISLMTILLNKMAELYMYVILCA